jgi:peptidoglycan/LPS O-acetylase OafA/YrhL
MKDSTIQLRSRWTEAKRLLLPLDTGSQDIRALDGLRAIAALSIVTFHWFLTGRYEYTSWGKASLNEFYFLATGVQLFFVLSGFLLFLPYARALLHAQPLPSAKRFYQRRALRILPAYLVCLTLLLLLVPRTPGITGWLLVGDIVTHVLFLHDTVPLFVQDIEGPFWTLAVEVQFYLVLPLLALLLARVVGATRSLGRLAAGLGGLIGGVLTLRTIDAVVMAHLPALSSPLGALGQIFVLLSMGTLGKYLEVFAIGMLCAGVYVATVEDHRFPVSRQRLVAWLLLGEALLLFLALIPLQQYASTRYAPDTNMGVLGIVVPGLIGLAYGTLLLAIVWGNGLIRAPFECYPLRFIGLISFSLYLWHLPLIHPLIPALASHSLLKVWLPLAFVVAYLSYQLVERPFLQRQRRGERPLPHQAADAVQRVPGVPAPMET